MRATPPHPQRVFMQQRPVRDVDQYGRLVPRVYVDELDLSLALVEQGLAWHFTRYSDDQTLAEAERAARAAGVGLWRAPNPVPPWGVVARIVTGPHDANRQDPHRPMRYDTGRPRAVIRFKISQPRTGLTPLPSWIPGAKAIADDGLVAEERILHPALTMVP